MNIDILSDLKMLKIGDYKKIESYYKNKKEFIKSEEVKRKLLDFVNFCSWATDEQVKKELHFDLSSYFQILAGYYYTRAEDFNYNPYIKIDSLKKAVIYCNLLKNHNPNAEIYSNKYICKINRNYL